MVGRFLSKLQHYCYSSFMLETCSVLAVSVIVVDQTQCVCDVIDSKWCFELLSSLLYFAEVSRFEKLQDLFSF